MPFKDASRALNSMIGAQRLRAVIPHDTNELALGICDAVWVGGAGNISVITEDDTDPVLISGVPAGTRLDIRAKIIRSTLTTATLIVAWY